MAFRPFAFLTGSNRKDRAEWRAGSGDPVLRLAPDGEILASSDGARTLIGGETNLKGRSILDFAGRDDRAALKEALSRALQNTRAEAAERLKFRLLRPHAGPVFTEIALVRDGHDLSALLRDRGPELAALRQSRGASDKASAADEARPDTAMLADLGHELKTPLGAIMGFAEAMRAEAFGPLGHDKYREYADLIHATGGHASDLIAAMLDRAKLDAGRYELAPALSSPAPLARTCAEMVRGEAERAGLDLNVEIAEDLPETMLDASAVRRIIVNLLNNAVKFTADGAVTLSVREKDGAIEFSVIDTGVGMSQTALARLGERFTALHKNGVRGTGGTGLGLSMAYRLANLHGGVLKLTSAPGEGTVAHFVLPVRKSLKEMTGANITTGPADIQSQLDRVAQYRRERIGRDAA
ncbi:PAS domain-containing sensor histidine kinase [Hyphococcus flavus]|uniref:histidine kinase n=1 Tax=Hyphococcus flavus TaxID=1866326 RepID=A0AAE9ZGJ4_9PROT|nr:PAS domain-containing sensor histidine kinase [Hyphococcus flavus]WDI32212.1 PAS domain-containing sensor histidine kinase [Hyphococcus flavus]